MDVTDVCEVTTREIRRKRKIQYNKIKGRLNQRGSNFLNRSVCHENVQKLNASSTANQSQLVSVNNINAFLDKNRLLAKTLQDAKCQIQELEKERFQAQTECIQMRAKLNISASAVLKCSCKLENTSGNVGSLNLLSKVRDSISESKDLFTELMDSLMMRKANMLLGKNTLVFGGNVSHIMLNDTQAAGMLLKEMSDVATQTDPISSRNKKLQVNSRCESKHLTCCIEDDKKEVEWKSTQTEKPCCESKMTQCLLVQDAFPATLKKEITRKMKKIITTETTVRTPLKSITNTVGRSPNLHSISNKANLLSHADVSRPNTSILKKTKAPFAIYEDKVKGDGMDRNGSNFHNTMKKVTIQSPAEVRIYNEEVGRLRTRKNRPIYTEPSLHKRLSKGDRNVDVKYYWSPAAKKRRRKAIPLQHIISLVEESMLELSIIS